MKKLIIFTNLFIMILLLSGCWSKKELNELTLITMMGIDKSDDEYILSVQAIVPRNAAGDTTSLSSPTAFYEAKSQNACDGFRKLTYDLPRFPTLSHVSNIIINEEIAREGLVNVIDCLMRDDQLRPSVGMFIAKGIKAQHFLKISTILESNSSTKIFKVIQNAKTNYSAVHFTPLYRFVNSLVSPESDSYLPGLIITGDPEKGKDFENVNQGEADTRINLVPYAIFKKDKLVGWLDEYTSKGTNLLLNEINSTMISTACDASKSKYYALDVDKANSKISVKMNGKLPSFNIETSIDGMFCQVDCAVDLHKPEEVDKIEKQFEEEVKKQLQTTIKTLQEYNTDIIGFRGYIHREFPNKWNKINKNWEEIFPTLEFKVKVNVIIRELGSTINPLEKDIK